MRMRVAIIALIAVPLLFALAWGEQEMNMSGKEQRELTPEEEAVIVSKGTEPPYSGECNEHSKKAVDTSRAYFAGGCFWGVEHLFGGKEGVVSAVSGYMGGAGEEPTYEQVVSGTTGHLETVEVEYDSEKVTYEELARFFFEIHDPTQENRQGPDVGEQYTSAVFYGSGEEKETAERLIGILKDRGYDVVTEVLPAGTFWKAEDYHQDYYERRGQKPYCHVYKRRF